MNGGDPLNVACRACLVDVGEGCLYRGNYCHTIRKKDAHALLIATTESDSLRYLLQAVPVRFEGYYGTEVSTALIARLRRKYEVVRGGRAALREATMWRNMCYEYIDRALCHDADADVSHLREQIVEAELARAAEVPRVEADKRAKAERQANLDRQRREREASERIAAEGLARWATERRQLMDDN